MKGIVESYLEELREALSLIMEESRTSFFTKASTIPMIILVFITANASSPLTPVITVCFSIASLLLASKDSIRRGFAPVLKPLLMITMFALVISIPLLASAGSRSEALFFMERVISSTIVFTFLLRSVGLTRVLAGLRDLRIPQLLVRMLELTLRFIPVFVSDTLVLLMAREARMLAPQPRSSVWRSLSTVVSEIVVRANDRAGMLSLAMEARNLGSSKTENSDNRNVKLRVGDAIIIIGVITALLIEVLVR